MHQKRSSTRGLRALAGLLVAGGALALAAGPAGAHATFTNTKVEANSDASITLDVPNEQAEGEYWNVQIKLQVPSGWSFKGCTPPSSLWTCTNQPSGGHDVIVWTADNPNVDTGAETFPFQLHTPGADTTALFPTLQIYNKDLPSGGRDVLWGDDGGDTPAPKLTTVPGPPPTVPPTTPTDHGNPTTPPTVPPTSPVGPTTPTTATGPGASSTTTQAGVNPNTVSTSTTSTSTTTPESTTTTEPVPGTTAKPTGTTTGTAPGTTAGPTGARNETAAPATTPASSSSNLPLLLGLLVVFVLAGLGIGLLVRSRMKPAAAGDDPSAPTQVDPED